MFDCVLCHLMEVRDMIAFEENGATMHQQHTQAGNKVRRVSHARQTVVHLLLFLLFFLCYCLQNSDVVKFNITDRLVYTC